MNRRRFLSFLGLAPLAAVPAIAAATDAPAVDLITQIQKSMSNQMAAGSRDLAMMDGWTAECGPEGVLPLTRTVRTVMHVDHRLRVEQSPNDQGGTDFNLTLA